MLLKTRGIVLKNTKYSETSVISKLYTRELGMQSYIINGIHSPKAAIKPSLLQPLTLLDIVVYFNKLKDIQRIKEAKPNPLLESLPFDVVKSSTGLFMSELIHKSVKEEEPNERMFDFMEHCIIYLDESEAPQPLLPLYFMVFLTNFLGFAPRNNRTPEDNIFNLREGLFTGRTDSEENSINPPHADYLSLLLNTSLERLNSLHIPKASRNFLLQKMVTYYMLHLPGFLPLKSLAVLTNILRND